MLSVSSIQTAHRIISAVLSKAVKWGYIAFNPAINADLPKMNTKKAAYLDVEDARLLLNLLHNEPIKYRAMVSIDLLTGLRRGELLGLRWCDIDFDNEVITVAQTSNYVKGRGVYVDTPKSETSERQIKVAQTAFILLREYKAWQDERRDKCGDYWKETDDRIFTSEDGSLIHPDSLTRWFKSFVTRHGFPDVHLHSLRHTYASIMIADGTPLVVVSSNLGHAQVSTTSDIYSHVIKSSAVKAAESVNTKFADVVESPPVEKKEKTAG
jgi:integrase